MPTVLSPPVIALRDGAWRLAELVATPLVPGDYLDLVSPLRSGSDLRGRIESIEPETADAATVTIRPGRTWRGHVPGQYVRIGIDVDGVRQWRAYSITSAGGRADRCFTITVKAIPDGIVSNHLVHRATPGTIVQLDQATGDFTLPPAPPAKVLFVTAGSGITPVVGMLRAHPELDDVVHVHIAPTSGDVIFGAELRHRGAQRAGYRLHEHHDEGRRFFEVAHLEELVPDWREREAWACGPAGLLDALERHYAEAGQPDRLNTERFRASIIVAGDGGRVTFAHSSTEVDADGATPLLDVGEAAGVLMPSGCRMGICFGCVAPLREGAVRDLRNGDITTASPGDDVLIQTCVSAAAGACHIDL